MPGRLARVNMMTNPVYLGHWMYKERIVVWNNHPSSSARETRTGCLSFRCAIIN